ncbi:MAG: hypothetical protein QF876_08060 [Desulfobacterales bacterium]|nr:hypothetical protein [Desulfobacterales bacterium]
MPEGNIVTPEKMSQSLILRNQRLILNLVSLSQITGATSSTAQTTLKLVSGTAPQAAGNTITQSSNSVILLRKKKVLPMFSMLAIPLLCQKEAVLPG